MIEDMIRKIVRDELRKYFCNIQNNEELTYTETNYYETTINNLSDEIRVLKEKNKELEHQLAQCEFDLAINRRKNLSTTEKLIFNKA